MNGAYVSFLSPAQEKRLRKPLFDDQFYDRWAARQRERWVVEELVFVKEHARADEDKRRRRGKRDVLGVVSLLLGILFVCIALFVGAQS